jgi:DNA-binding XRE family transcriptional regulator
MPVETVLRHKLQRAPQVAAARKRKGLTQQQLADALGINRVSLARVEAGTRTPSMGLALRITHVLDESVEALFGGGR